MAGFTLSHISRKGVESHADLLTGVQVKDMDTGEQVGVGFGALAAYVHARKTEM